MKGISKQVIVVHSQDKKLFDQAIFFLSEEAMESGKVTDAALLREAKLLFRNPMKKHRALRRDVFFTLCGGVFVGLIWLLTAIV